MIGLLLHGDDRMNLVYFWSSVLTVLLPLAVFVTLAVLTVRGYFRRKTADGGGPPPMRNRDDDVPNQRPSDP